MVENDANLWREWGGHESLGLYSNLSLRLATSRFEKSTNEFQAMRESYRVDHFHPIHGVESPRHRCAGPIQVTVELIFSILTGGSEGLVPTGSLN